MDKMMFLIQNYNLDKMLLWLFLISILAFRIPNFYLLPFFPSSFLTFQAIARILFALVFVYNILIAFTTNKPLFAKKEHLFLFTLILFLFCIQSLSILVAENIPAFLSRYKDICLGVIACFNFYFYRDHYKMIAITLIVALPINLLYQLLMVINTAFFISLFQSFIYDRHFEMVLVNIARSRTYVETYDEIIVPLLFVYFHDKFGYLSSLNIILAFFSFISNWRIRVAMYIFALFLSVTLLFKQKFSFFKIIILACALLIVSYSVDTLLLSRHGFSFYDRILLSETGDIQTITSRFDQIQYGIDMARTNVLGVGLGNYYDNLSFSHKIAMNTNTLSEQEGQMAKEYVHNYFGLLAAESGFISVLIFTIIVYYFIKNDIKIMRTENQYKKAFVISFWTLFLFAMLNPLVPGSSQVLFWGIRGLLFN